MTARELREIRLAKGQTQRQFALSLGVAEHTVWRWENGYNPISHPYPILIRTVAALPLAATA